MTVALRNAPSMKRLMEDMKLDKDQAKRIRGLIHGEIKTNTSEAVNNWVAQCHHKPNYIERLLVALNEAADTYGVEYLTQQGGMRATHAYLNVGDPYVPTIIYNYNKDHFYIGCWGTIVENGNYD